MSSVCLRWVLRFLRARQEVGEWVDFKVCNRLALLCLASVKNSERDGERDSCLVGVAQSVYVYFGDWYPPLYFTSADVM